jgi:hypothetical protein
MLLLFWCQQDAVPIAAAVWPYTVAVSDGAVYHVTVGDS